MTEPTPKDDISEIPPIQTASPRRIGVFQIALLTWYEKNGRDLPWRKTRDPYHILVSEMMLHQTQVDRVIPKYHEFLSIYPTIASLATASLKDVKQLWRPLGYNFRPGRLHAIAKIVISNHNGKIPETFDELLALRGIGRYTAGAILSFAFHKDAPIIDTNVRRVLQRFFDVPGDPMRVPAKKQLWWLAEAVIPPGKGYLFNQALLDFGATICTARNPSCDSCILRDECPYPESQN